MKTLTMRVEVEVEVADDHPAVADDEWEGQIDLYREIIQKQVAADQYHLVDVEWE